MQQATATERRSAPRHRADWHVMFGLPGALVRGFIADIGPGGVCILSEKEYAVGTSIELHFWSWEDHERELLAHAVVRHCAEQKVGAQFINLDFSHRELLWKLRQGAL